MIWPVVALGDLFEIARGGSPRPIDAFLTDAEDGVNWVSISDATESDKYIRSTKRKIKASGVSRSRAVEPGDFLLTNSMSFGRPYIMATSGCIHDGWLSLRPKTDHTNADYLFRALGASDTYRKFEKLASGATVKNLNIDLVKSVEIPLPPLHEQRRIAAILDQADALRRHRQAGIDASLRLISAVFDRIFNHPTAGDWGSVPFGEVLARPLRNGISPASDGTIPAEVLTLSAITGQHFDGSARKGGMFRTKPPAEQRVRARDFMICRGNGNTNLVGRGVFPSEDMPEVAFPDTVIAGEVDPSRINPAFLEFAWNSEPTRVQIRQMARTTNGTYKVNQQMLERILLPSPPIDLQHQFAASALSIRRQQARMAKQAETFDALSASLEHRAFKGELTAKAVQRELAEAG